MNLLSRLLKSKRTSSPNFHSVYSGGDSGHSGRHREEGVTLLISLIMLASVMFISLSLSSVVLREIGATRQVLRTEPAITGSDAGGEVGLYAVLRQTGQFEEQRTLPKSGVAYDFQTDLHDYPFPFTIAVGEFLEVGLYDPEDGTNLAADYGSVTIRNVNRAAVVEVFNAEFNLPAVCSGSVSPGGSYTCSALTAYFNGDDRFKVIVRPSGGLAMEGEIVATDNSGQAKGVPTGDATIIVTGSLNDVQRKIEVNLSEPPP